MGPIKRTAKMVISDEEGISDTMTLVLCLEHSFNDMIDWALKAQQQEENEDLLLSQG